MQPVEGEAVFQDREDFLSPVHFPQADKGLQQLYLLRGQFFSVLAPELRRLPEQRRVDAGRIAVHLLLRLPVLPEQAQPVQDFPDPGPLRGAEDIVPVLAVVVEGLVQENDLSESRRREGDPVIVHHRMLRHRMPPEDPRQSPVHHHGAAGHVVLDQQPVQTVPLRRHLLIPHIGGGDHISRLVRDPHVAMNQKRRVSAVLLLRCQHDPQSFLHFLRMPDIVLIREQDVVGVSSEGMENAHEMACRASGRFRPLHELHPVRIQFLIIAGDAGGAVR